MIEQETIDYYIDLLEKIRERVGNTAESIAILAEIRADQRTQRTTEKRVVSGSMPATESQIGYLRRLGAEIPEEGLTRQKASQMIDEQKERIAVQKAMEIPMRIP